MASYITDRGLARLLARDYKVTWRGPALLMPADKVPGKRPLESYGYAERRMRLKNQIAHAFDEYLRAGGCSVPGCPCIIVGSPRKDWITIR